MKKILFFVTLMGPLAYADLYKIDVAHTQIGFKVKHLVISTVSGRFDKFAGTLNYDPNTGDMKDVFVSIDAASIDTNEPDRDKHLKSSDFFDVEKFPKLEFVSSKTTVKNKKPVKIEGNLTIHGVTKPVTLKMEFGGVTTDPMGHKRLALEASGTIDRKEFGLKWNKNLDQGGVMISDKVKMVIEGEALLQ